MNSKTRRVLLAVDFSYQTARAAAAHPGLTSRRVFTGGLYGFFTTVSKIVRETQATRIVFCKDSKPYVRSQEYPAYKQLRKKSEDDELLRAVVQTRALVNEIFEELGIPFWEVPGFEADDLIAHAAIKYRHRYDRIIAASNDSDLFQLLDIGSFRIYTKSLATMIDRDVMVVEQKMTPEEFMLATAMTGTHNDVEGIARVGPVTALKILRDPTKMRATMEVHKELIERNLKLIKLPHPTFPKQTILPPIPQPINPRMLYKALGRYDIDVTKSMIDAFTESLCYER